MGNIRLIKWLPCSFTSQISSVSHITQIIRLIDTIGLIGYFRFALAIAAYYFINDPNRFLPLYVISCLLDAVDGHAARFLNQCSRFGAVLDMVADRSTTAGLICYLAHIYPKFMLLWQVLIGLDLSSHYMHMYASLATGSTSHKIIDKRQNFLLRAYYSYQSVLFMVCAGNELFYLAAYMMAHSQGPLIAEVLGRKCYAWETLLAVSAPIWAFKQFMNVVQMVGAAKKLATVEQKLHVK